MESLGKVSVPCLPRPGSTTTSNRTSLCAECEGTGWVRDPQTDRVRKCPCKLERQAEASVPELYRGARLTDFDGRLRAAGERWLLDPASLMISGNVGSGKTHFACALCIARRLAGLPALFRPMAELYRELRKAIQAGESDVSIVEDYLAVGCLFLDDIGSGALSDFEIRTALDILDGRHIRRRPTVVTTNWSLEEIASKMDDRVASRLSDFSLLRFEGRDLRGQARAGR